MGKIRKLALLSVVFVLGLTVGSTATKHVILKRVAMFHSGPKSEHVDYYVHRLDRRLDLEAGQRERVAEIVEEVVAEMARIRGEYKPQLQDVIERGHLRVKEILSDEQRLEYDELMRRYEKKMYL